jgi:hypothetical protein
LLALLVGLVWAGVASAEEEAKAPDATALAKQTQNPVADLISMPLQFNFNNGGAYGAETMFNLNFQPVMPFTLTDDWNVIARTIVPFYNFPGGSTSGDRVTGVGDIQLQLYLSPKNPGALIWGVGPVMSFPTAVNGFVQTGSWAAGPAAVALKMSGPWVIGGLLNQLWTYSDHGDEPETNLLVLQPFINYNLKKGWAISLAPLITANWDAADGQEWTVPLGLGVTRTTRFGKRPLNIAFQYYANVVRPDNGPGNQFRIVVAPLYPK